MTTSVVLARSGMGIDEGTIARWLKAEGDRVEAGELIAEVETAKATQEIEAPIAGVLTKIIAAEGVTVAVNSEIALIKEYDG